MQAKDPLQTLHSDLLSSRANQDFCNKRSSNSLVARSMEGSLNNYKVPELAVQVLSKSEDSLQAYLKAMVKSKTNCFKHSRDKPPINNFNNSNNRDKMFLLFKVLLVVQSKPLPTSCNSTQVASNLPHYPVLEVNHSNNSSTIRHSSQCNNKNNSSNNNSKIMLSLLKLLKLNMQIPSSKLLSNRPLSSLKTSFKTKPTTSLLNLPTSPSSSLKTNASSKPNNSFSRLPLNTSSSSSSKIKDKSSHLNRLLKSSRLLQDQVNPPILANQI